MSGELSVGDETELLEPLGLIPDMYDVTVTLISPQDDNGQNLVETNLQNFTVTNEFGIVETFESSAEGIINMELNVGTYNIEQVGLDDCTILIVHYL